MRRFEEQYRINEADDVLVKENAVHRDVDLRLDDVEQGIAAYRAGQRDDIEAILKSLEATFGQLAGEMRGLLDQASGGLSADIIVETDTRTFWTAARATALKGDLLGGVDAAGNTLAKLYALLGTKADAAALTAAVAALKGGADAAHDTLGELAALVDAATAAAAANATAIAGKADAAATTAALGNRLRGDADGGYAAGVRDQFRWNIGAAVPLSVSANTALAVLDYDRDVYATGSPTITMPNGGVNWRSGPISNDNTLSGFVTLAVPAGATLDGVLNGTTKLRPYQIARIRQTGATAYRTQWVLRSPELVSATLPADAASANWLLPAGYIYEFSVSNVSVSINAALLWIRFAYDAAGAVFSAGTSDYFYTSSYTTNQIANGNPAQNYSSANSFIELCNSMNSDPASAAGIIRGIIRPGLNGRAASANYDSAFSEGTGSWIRRSYSGLAPIGQLTGIQLGVNTGNIKAGTNVTIIGRPV